ncbi:MAG: pantoate--beta-alanine ligase [Longimonas sp.]|uniref:pantoate--beta-alanine ligase n=1 Tax=Longimonas sp. TaxID=2039626 RepID=UPI00334C51A7
MNVITDVSAMQAWSDAQHRDGRTVALVPTMGALHQGHLALVEEAQEQADTVVVSIFVNPTQFAPDEDYEAYPRTLQADREALESYDGVEAIFAPTVEAMYPFGASTTDDPYISVDVHTLNDHLCGRYRPGHFEGVVTVVTKLLNASKPDIAIFGQKDAQQLVILKHLVRALRFDVDVVGIPTVRESDGLACSSRNAYLSEAERAEASCVYAAIQAGVQAIEDGEQQVDAVVRAMRKPLSAAEHARIQYTSVVDAETLQPKTQLHPNDDVLIAAAVFFGDTRLIDNAFIRVPSSL